MKVLSFQTLFNVPVDAAVTRTPVQGASRDVQHDPAQQPKFRNAAMVATGLVLVLVPASQLAFQQPWQDFGGQIQAPQPPHPKPEKSGGLVGGDPGHYARAAQPLQTADYVWHETPWVYPRKNYQLAGAVAPKADGIDRPFAVWFNLGFDQAQSQPKAPTQERGWALIKSEDVLFRTFAELQTADYAWLETPWVYPRKNWRGAGILEGIDGTDAPFLRWQNAGWEVQSIQPPHGRPERSGAVAPCVVIDARFVAWRNAGWEVQPPQPPHRRSERAGSIAPLVTIEARYQDWRFVGFEIQAVQPPHRGVERKATILKGDDGITATMPVGLQTATYPFGIDGPFIFPRKRYVTAALRLFTDFEFAGNVPVVGPDGNITDTDILQKPIDYILHGEQNFSLIGREYDIRPMDMKSRGSTPRSGVKQIKGGKPSFTTKTGKRGYD